MLTITSDDLGNVGQALRQLSGSLKNTRPLMRGIATLLENATRKRFETKTAPDGTRWANWTPSTQRAYAKPIYRQRNKKRYVAALKPRSKERLMRDSSRLLRSLTRHATANLAQVGTNVVYAPHHQFGTKRMVARPMFGLSAQDSADIVDLLHDFVREQWEQS